MSRADVEINSKDGACRTSVFRPAAGVGPWPAVIFYMDAVAIRPTLYDAHHDIRSVRESKPGAERIIADVVGPVCESGDFFALDRSIVAPEAGDLFALMTAGAYGATQAGTYNSRPLIPEVLVRQEEWALVRPRQRLEELIALDRLPPWL